MAAVGSVSAVAFFCDSIRQEIDGKFQLLGILNDNLAVPFFPGVLGALDVYARVHYVPDQAPRAISMAVKFAGDDGDIGRIQVDSSMILTAVADARKFKSPTTGHFLVLKLRNISVEEPNRINAIIAIDDEEVIAGTLNIYAASA